MQNTFLSERSFEICVFMPQSKCKKVTNVVLIPDKSVNILPILCYCENFTLYNTKQYDSASNNIFMALNFIKNQNQMHFRQKKVSLK